MSVQLTDEHGEFLVKLARRAIETFLSSRKVLSPPDETPKELWEPMGVFVTLNKLVEGRRVLRLSLIHI